MLPLIYYKGYTAHIYTPENRGEALEVIATADGLVQVNKDVSDVGEIVVSYDGTIVQTISEWISIITVLALIIWRIRKYMLNRKAIRE